MLFPSFLTITLIISELRRMKPLINLLKDDSIIDQQPRQIVKKISTWLYNEVRYQTSSVSPLSRSPCPPLSNTIPFFYYYPRSAHYHPFSAHHCPILPTTLPFYPQAELSPSAARQEYVLILILSTRICSTEYQEKNSNLP